MKKLNYQFSKLISLCSITYAPEIAPENRRSPKSVKPKGAARKGSRSPNVIAMTVFIRVSLLRLTSQISRAWMTKTFFRRELGA